MPPDQPTSGGVPSGTDDEWLLQWVSAAWRRWRLEIAGLILLWASAAGLIAFGLLSADTARAAGTGLVVAAVVATAGLRLGRGLRDVRPLLERAEQTTPALHNALLTWHEARSGLAPRVASGLAAQAREALAAAPSPRAASARTWGLAIACVAVAVAFSVLVPHRGAAPVGPARPVSASRAPAALEPLDWTATITPPGYTGRARVQASRPTRLEVLAGSEVVLRVTGWQAGMSMRLGASPLADTADADARVARVTAVAADVLLIVRADGTVAASLALIVRPDAAPLVRITRPAEDLRRTQAIGTVAIAISARDDIGLRDLRLRFTRVSGSGESFTFEDGEWPVAVERTSTTAWEARHVVDLAALGLAPGDSVVYHALAHDARPGAAGAAESERYLIEITRPGAQAAGDFSLPESEEKFALSQRMVILLTERLLERRPRMRAEEYRAEAQALAIAQRRVRAEFVFMLGGEVEDEVEEAAHSHEIEAGRLDNRGQSDLTDAVRQMAQAERHLTDADLREALPYEYRALASLQAAFGRARYFMRTLPTPVQIDPTRRLTGDREAVASAAWSFAPLPPAGRREALTVLHDLEAGPTAPHAGVLAALARLEPGNGAWVAQVHEVAGRDGRDGLARLLRSRLLAASPSWVALPLSRSADEAFQPAERQP